MRAARYPHLVKGRATAAGSELEAAHVVNAANGHTMQKKVVKARRQWAIIEDAADLVNGKATKAETAMRIITKRERDGECQAQVSAIVLLPILRLEDEFVLTVMKATCSHKSARFSPSCWNTLGGCRG